MTLSDELRQFLLLSDKDALSCLGLAVAKGNGLVPDKILERMHCLQHDVSELLLLIQCDNHYRRFG